MCSMVPTHFLGEETMAEKKGRFEFDDKIKEGAKKAGGEIKEHGGELKKDVVQAGHKVKEKLTK